MNQIAISHLSETIPTNDNENLLQLCEKIGRNAQAKGLTEEILAKLLADES